MSKATATSDSGAVTRQAATPRRRPDGPFAELLPWAGEQVADWEAAASAGVQLPDVSLPLRGDMHAELAWRHHRLIGVWAGTTTSICSVMPCQLATQPCSMPLSVRTALQDVAPELSMFATDARGAAPWVAAVIRTSEGAAPRELLEVGFMT